MNTAEAVERIRKAKVRKDAVAVYLDALKEWPAAGISWRAINDAVVARWSISALIWIKQRAWKEARP